MLGGASLQMSQSSAEDLSNVAFLVKARSWIGEMLSWVFLGGLMAWLLQTALRYMCQHAAAHMQAAAAGTELAALNRRSLHAIGPVRR